MLLLCSGLLSVSEECPLVQATYRGREGGRGGVFSWPCAALSPLHTQACPAEHPCPAEAAQVSVRQGDSGRLRTWATSCGPSISSMDLN